MQPEKNMLRTGATVAALSFVVYLAGCQTLQHSTVQDPEAAGRLTQQQAEFAEALACYSQGLSKQIQGDDAAALALFQQAVELDPAQSELHMRLAMGYLRDKQPEKAIAILQKLCEQQPDSAQAFLWLGFMHRASGDPEKAEAAYREAIKRAPEQPEAYLELATTFLRQGRDDDAIKLLAENVDRIEQPAELLRLLGDLYLRKAHTSAALEAETVNRQAAIQTFERAIQEVPNDVALLFQLGDLYILDEKLSEAISSYERIGELEPDNIRARKKLALSLAATGDQERAIETLEDIARQKPTSPYVYYYLGELYEKLGDAEKAKFNFTLATKTDPPEAAAFLKLALLQLEDDQQKAIETLQQAQAILPGHPEIPETLAYIHLNLRNYEDAVNYFRQTVQVSKEQDLGELAPLLHFNYGVAAQQAGFANEAAEQLNQAINSNFAFLEAYVQFVFELDTPDVLEQADNLLERLAPGHQYEAALYAYLGFLNSYRQDFQRAVNAFEKAEAKIAAAPAESEMLGANLDFWYAAACERIGEYDRAIELFKRCIEQAPDYADAYNYIAYMWAERSIHLDKALEYIRKALLINPDNGAFVDTLGWIYYQQGDYQKAYETISEALELMPEDPTILEHLGDALLKLNRQEAAITHWLAAYAANPDNDDLAAKLKEHGITPPQPDQQDVATQDPLGSEEPPSE